MEIQEHYGAPVTRDVASNRVNTLAFYGIASVILRAGLMQSVSNSAQMAQAMAHEEREVVGTYVRLFTQGFPDHGGDAVTMMLNKAIQEGGVEMIGGLENLVEAKNDANQFAKRMTELEWAGAESIAKVFFANFPEAG